MSTTSMLNKISAAAAHLLVLQATDDDVSIQEKAVVQANALVAHAKLTRLLLLFAWKSGVNHSAVATAASYVAVATAFIAQGTSIT